MGVSRFIVTVDTAAGVPATDLAAQLREAGFDIAEQLDGVGIVLGQADEGAVGRIRGIRGVAAVERERSVERRRGSEELP